MKGKWLAIPHWYIRYPWIVNRGYLNEVKEDYNNKTTYEDILRIGAKLKKAGPHRHPVLADPGRQRRPLPHHGRLQGVPVRQGGEHLLRREGNRRGPEVGLQPVQGLHDRRGPQLGRPSNNRFIASGKGSSCNPISASRTAAKDNPDVYKNLEIKPPPLGPAGRVGGARTMSYGIYKFSQVQDLAKEFLYAMNAAGLQGMEASTGYNHPSSRRSSRSPCRSSATSRSSSSSRTSTTG